MNLLLNKLSAIALLLFTACFMGACAVADHANAEKQSAPNIREIFLILPDAAFSELHPIPSLSLRRKMMAEGFNGSNRFFDEKGITYRLSTEKRFLSDSFLAFANTFPGGGGVFYSMKSFNVKHDKLLIAVRRVYGEKCCERSKTLFFTYSSGVWRDISSHDPLKLRDLRLLDFISPVQPGLSQALLDHPPTHVRLPVHGNNVRIELDREQFMANKEVRKSIKTMDKDETLSFFRDLNNVGSVLVLYKGDGSFMQQKSE